MLRNQEENDAVGIYFPVSNLNFKNNKLFFIGQHVEETFSYFVQIMLETSMERKLLPEFLTFLEQELHLADIKVFDGLIGKTAYYLVGYLPENKQQKVFVKWLPCESSDTNPFEAEFNYIKLLHDAEKSHFAQPFFCGSIHTVHYFVMEYFEGEQLNYFFRKRKLSIEDRKNIVLQIKEIAKQLFEKQIIHNDLSPMNFLYSKTKGHLKLIDFGSAISEDILKQQRSQLIDVYMKHHLFLMGVLRYDNVRSLLKILRRIGYRKEYGQAYRETKSFILSQPERIIATDFVVRFSLQGGIGQLQDFLYSKLLQAVTIFIPVSSWRKRVRRIITDLLN
jgi:serine/threonine protein kinase